MSGGQIWQKKKSWMSNNLELCNPEQNRKQFMVFSHVVLYSVYADGAQNKLKSQY